MRPVPAVESAVVRTGVSGPMSPETALDELETITPSAPRAPVAPSAPVAPLAPVAPAGPVAPADPGGPAGPWSPSRPSKPSGPRAPWGPGGPCGPATPPRLLTLFARRRALLAFRSADRARPSASLAFLSALPASSETLAAGPTEAAADDAPSAQMTAKMMGQDLRPLAYRAKA